MDSNGQDDLVRSAFIHGLPKHSRKHLLKGPLTAYEAFDIAQRIESTDAILLKTDHNQQGRTDINNIGMNSQENFLENVSLAMLERLACDRDRIKLNASSNRNRQNYNKQNNKYYRLRTRNRCRKRRYNQGPYKPFPGEPFRN